MAQWQCIVKYYWLRGCVQNRVAFGNLARQHVIVE